MAALKARAAPAALVLSRPAERLSPVRRARRSSARVPRASRAPRAGISRLHRSVSAAALLLVLFPFLLLGSRPRRARVLRAPLRAPRLQGSWAPERRLLVPWPLRFRVRLRLRLVRGLRLGRRQRVSRVRSRRRRRHRVRRQPRGLRLRGRRLLHRLRRRGRLRFRALVPVRVGLPIRPLRAWRLRSRSSGRPVVFAGAGTRRRRTDEASGERGGLTHLVRMIAMVGLTGCVVFCAAGGEGEEHEARIEASR